MQVAPDHNFEKPVIEFEFVFLNKSVFQKYSVFLSIEDNDG